jgi:hypothetical protein
MKTPIGYFSLGVMLATGSDVGQWMEHFGGLS